MKIHSFVAMVAAASLFSVSAIAGSVNSDGSVTDTDDFGGDMNVRVTVAEVCRVGAQDVDFGTIDGTQETDVTVVVDVNAQCPSGTDYTIELDYGISPADTQRRLLGGDEGGDSIDYVIYQPDGAGNASTSTPLWGTGAGAEYASTGTGAKQTFKASAVLNLSTGGSTGSSLTPGDYTDLVTLTLTY
jgi:spore coat protein U-like protein